MQYLVTALDNKSICKFSTRFGVMRNNQNLKKKLAEDYMYNYFSLVFMTSVIHISVQ